jgi:lysophospholipase L1-like esterase
VEESDQECTRPGIRSRLILLLAACLVGVLTAEAAVRGFRLAPKINRINPGMQKTVYRLSDNPVLGYVFKENYRDQDQPDLTSSYPYINAHGLRDRERTVEKAPGTKRIILLGDSIVAGAEGIRDHALTISGQLEDKYTESSIEVLNFGINGYCTRAEVELLKQKGLQFKPDLVILVFVGSNDFDDINADLGKVDLRQPWLVEKLFVYSHLFRRLALSYNLFNLRTAYGVNDIAGEWLGFLPSHAEDVKQVMEGGEPGKETLRAHLEGIGDNNVRVGFQMLKELAEQHDFRVVVGIWPDFFEEGIVDIETAYDGPRYPVEPDQELVVERLAAMHGFGTFRLVYFFRADFAQRMKQPRRSPINPMQVYSVDGMHANETGADVAARAIGRILKDHPELVGGRLTDSDKETGK